MKRLLLGLAVLPFLAGVSLAAQPVPLSDTQMDTVTAGFDFAETEVTNTSWTRVAVDLPVLAACPGVCYLQIAGTPYSGPPAIRSFQVQSQFGPVGTP
jgi:hypothetical protein